MAAMLTQVDMIIDPHLHDRMLGRQPLTKVPYEDAKAQLKVRERSPCRERVCGL